MTSVEGIKTSESFYGHKNRSLPSIFCSCSAWRPLEPDIFQHIVFTASQIDSSIGIAEKTEMIQNFIDNTTLLLVPRTFELAYIIELSLTIILVVYLLFFD